MELDILIATVTDVTRALNQGSCTSQALTIKYLEQISAYDGRLKSVIQLQNRDVLLQQAMEFDEKRKEGEILGRLHGVPIMIKDNIATHPSLGFDTSCGNWVLKESRPARNARIVDKLINEGALLLGKTNLSEMAYWKGSDLPGGWSAVGGQTQSAYVKHGFDPKDAKLGHSNPGGSSTGSAVAVSAGLCAGSIGTETFGSLVNPSDRAALYTIKPSIGLVSQEGIIPISPLCDSAGPMVKSAEDVALFLDILVEPGSAGIPVDGYQTALKTTWNDIRIATLDPNVWKPDPAKTKENPGIVEQMVREATQAYDRVGSLAKSLHNNVELITKDDFDAGRPENVFNLLHHNFKSAFENYLSTLASSPVRTLAELVEKNKEIAHKELPQGYPSQSILEQDLSSNLSPEEEAETLAYVRHTSRDGPRGIDTILKKYHADVIIGLADSPMYFLAAAAGYPIATLPLSTLESNGRPFGLAALAGQYQEAKLIGLQKIWEETFAARAVPPLGEDTGEKYLGKESV